MAMHSDSLSFSQTVVKRLENLEDDTKVSRLVVFPSEIIEMDSVWVSHEYVD